MINFRAHVHTCRAEKRPAKVHGHSPAILRSVVNHGQTHIFCQAWAGVGLETSVPYFTDFLLEITRLHSRLRCGVMHVNKRSYCESAKKNNRKRYLCTKFERFYRGHMASLGTLQRHAQSSWQVPFATIPAALFLRRGIHMYTALLNNANATAEACRCAVDVAVDTST